MALKPGCNILFITSLQRSITALPAHQRSRGAVHLQVSECSRPGAGLSAAKWTARYGLNTLGRCAQCAAVIPTPCAFIAARCTYTWLVYTHGCLLWQGASAARTDICSRINQKRCGQRPGAQPAGEHGHGGLRSNSMVRCGSAAAASNRCVSQVHPPRRKLSLQQRCPPNPPVVVKALPPVKSEGGQNWGIMYRAAGRQSRHRKDCSGSWPCAMLGASRSWLSQASSLHSFVSAALPCVAQGH